MQRESLRGHLLVAGGGLSDPNFRRSVVLVGEHDEEGALGIVLNRPSAVPLAQAVPALADLAELAGRGEPLYVGGPVQPQAVVVLAEFADRSRAGRLVVGAVGFPPEEMGSETVAAMRRVRVFAGYAGWGPGQLEAELAEAAWIVEPARPGDLFTGRPEGLWSKILRRKGGSFAMLALLPPDPSMN